MKKPWSAENQKLMLYDMDDKIASSSEDLKEITLKQKLSELVAAVTHNLRSFLVISLAKAFKVKKVNE